jgi:hypothetical protein
VGGTANDGGTTSTTTETDDAGNVLDSGTVTTTGGGIWVPPSGHVIAPNSATQTTVTGATSNTYTVKGLVNQVTYTVVVAAVDNFGNVGLPSTQVCDFPAPINDFFTDYRDAGGQAGGGLCALEAPGAPAASTVGFGAAMALVAASIRRRRKSRRDRAQ